MPGNGPAGDAEGGGYGSRGSGVAGFFGDLAIAHDLAFRDSSHDGEDLFGVVGGHLANSLQLTAVSLLAALRGAIGSPFLLYLSSLYLI